MQIIEKGKYPENNKIECESCHCKFQYYNSEIVTDMTSPDEEAFLGGFGVHKYVKCPQCDYICTISSNFIEYEPFKGLKTFFKKIFNKKEKEN